MNPALHRKIRNSALLLSIAAPTLILSGLGRADDPAKPKEIQPPSIAVGIRLVTPSFTDLPDKDICKIRTAMEEQQGSLRDGLIQQLQDEHLSPLGRVESISLLSGFYPDIHVINALIENMDVVAYRRPDETNIGAGRYVGYIARHILARIGAPAEKAIFESIGFPQPAAPAAGGPAEKGRGFESKVEGFAGVLTEIEGKPEALVKLKEAQGRATNPVVKAQFQQVVDAVNRGEKPPFTY